MSTFGETIHVDTSEAFLEHYGVKGMKWGVRRSREQIDRSGSASSSSSSSASSTTSKASKVKSALTSDKAKKVAKGTVAAAAVVGMAYAGYSLNKNHNVKVDAIKTAKTLNAAKTHLDLHVLQVANETKMSRLQTEMAQYAVRDSFRRGLNVRRSERQLRNTFDDVARQTKMTRTQRDMLDWAARDTFVRVR